MPKAKAKPLHKHNKLIAEYSRWIIAGTSIFVFSYGILVLLSWYAGTPRIASLFGLPPVTPISALLFVLSASLVYLMGHTLRAGNLAHKSNYPLMCVSTLAFTILVLVFLVSSEHLFYDAHGRRSIIPIDLPPTAFPPINSLISFAITSVVGILFVFNTQKFHTRTLYCFGVMAVINFLALIGVAFDISWLEWKLVGNAGTTPGGVVLFFMLFTGLIFVRVNKATRA